MKTLLSAVVAATLALAAVAAGADGTPQERQVSLVIESKTLAEALDQWAQQTGFQIFVPNWEMAKKMSAPRLQGKYGARDALDRLLEGTPLMGIWTTDKAVTIREKATPIAWQLDPSQGRTVQKFVGDGLDGNEAAAAAPGTPQGYDTAAPALGSAYQAPPVSDLEEVIVTGTHIHGVNPPGVKLLVISREDIDRHGYATVQEVMKALPENFGGGASEDASDASTYNLSKGTAINLRGLGPDSTLVLINGRRQAPSGTNGSFVDISSIPVAAIERVEILRDGASAIYGADAVGGVVNFILRRDYDGAETRVRAGTYGGDSDTVQIGQVFGKKWNDTSVLVGYQYDDRERLARADRAYTASDDLRRFGGTDFRQPFSSPGNFLDLTTFQPGYAIPAGQDGRSLSVNELLPGVVNLQSASAGDVDLLPHQRSNSAFFTGTTLLGEATEVFAEARYNEREMSFRDVAPFDLLFVTAANPFYVNPYDNIIPGLAVVEYSFVNDLGPGLSAARIQAYGAAAGVTTELANSWSASLSGNYSLEKNRLRATNILNSDALAAALADPNPVTAFNPFGSGGSANNPATVRSLSGFQSEDSDFRVLAANLSLDGPVQLFGAQGLHVAFGVDYRTERLEATTDSTFYRNANLGPGVTDLDRDVFASYAELLVPVFGAKSDSAAGSRLELSLAARYEDYSDFGDTLNPKIGLTWTPVAGLSLRGSWGTSFKPPRISDLAQAVQVAGNGSSLIQFATMPDPQSASGVSSVLILTGNNAALSEETSRTWTAGIEFQPAVLPQLHASVSYFDIEFKDRIVIGGPTNPFAFLVQEAAFRDLVRRNPSRAEVDALCNDPAFIGSRTACLVAQPAAIVDRRLNNLAFVETRGLDADLGYEIGMPGGALAFLLNGTYVLSFDRQATDNAPTLDVVDTVGNQPALRLRGGVSWSLNAFTAELSANHTGSYDDDSSLPRRRVGSYTTVDAGVSYNTRATSGILGKMTIGLNVLNAFDKLPPFVNIRGAGYDTANAELWGRNLSLRFQKEW